MKYIPLAIILIALLITVFISFSMSGAGGFNALDLWVYAPFIISALLSALYVSKRIKSHIFGISGAITCLITLFPYYSAHTYSGSDGQVGLIFAVMPVYQYIGILVFGFIGHLIMYIRSR